jgi:hypothetical protein
MHIVSKGIEALSSMMSIKNPTIRIKSLELWYHHTKEQIYKLDILPYDIQNEAHGLIVTYYRILVKKTLTDFNHYHGKNHKHLSNIKITDGAKNYSKYLKEC